jgi:hypothetical protein
MVLRATWLAVVALLGAAAPAAGSVWSPPQQLSDAPGWHPSVSMSAGGGAIVAWTGNPGFMGAGGAVGYVSRPDAASPFSLAREMPATASGPPPSAAEDGGLAHLLLRRQNGVDEATGPLGGELTATAALPHPTESVAFGRDGRALAVWTDGDAPDGRNRLLYASWRPAGGSFGAVQAIGQTEGFPPAVAIDGDGRGLVAWKQLRTSGPQFDVMAVACTDSGCGESEALSDPARPADSFSPVVAVNRRGDVALAWTLADGYPTGHTVQVALRPAGAGFGSPTTIDGGSFVNTPDVALNEGRGILLVWSGASGLASVVVPPAGSPLPVQSVPGSERAGGFDIGYDADGNGVVTWTDNTYEGNRQTQAAERATDGSWVGPQVISDVPKGDRILWAQAAPRLAFDAAGGGLVTWDLAPDWQVMAAEYRGLPGQQPPARITAPAVHAGPKALRLSYRLDRAATVRIRVDRLRSHRARAVLRTATKGRAGRNSLILRSRRAKLRPGTYRMSLAAIGSGARATKHVRFRVR